MTAIGGVDVSRETLAKLESFVDLVEKWSPKINLISKPSVRQIWDRHIADSAQLFGLTEKQGLWVDLGSGGGFPGIVIAILATQEEAKWRVTLVESDQRKSAFLRTAIRELDLNANAISERIEDIEPLGADVISARALAELSTLIGFADRHLKVDGTALFPKGQSWQKEHDDAQRQWSYTCEPIRSETNASAAVLKIKDIASV